MSGQNNYRRGSPRFSGSLESFWGNSGSDDEYVYSDEEDKPLTSCEHSPDSQTLVDLFKDDHFVINRENSPQKEENPATNGFIPEGWGVGCKPNSPVQQVQETKVTFNTRTGWGVPSVGSRHSQHSYHTRTGWGVPSVGSRHSRHSYHTPYVPVTFKITQPKVYIFDADDDSMVTLSITKKERIETRGDETTTIVVDEGGTFTLSNKEAVAKLKNYSSSSKYVSTGHGMPCELSKLNAKWIMEKYSTTPSYWRHVAMSCICHFGGEKWWDYDDDEAVKIPNFRHKPVSQQGLNTDFLTRSESIIDEAVRIWNLRYKAVYIMLRNILKNFGVYRADQQFEVINEWLLRKILLKENTDNPWESEFIYRFQKLMNKVIPEKLLIECKRDLFINFMVNSREVVIMHEDAKYMYEDKVEVKPTSYTFLA